MDYSVIKHISSERGYTILPVKVGQQLEIHETIGEGNTKRIWKFKCLVLKVQNPNQHGGTFTVRGLSSGIEIEKVYPLSFTKFQKIILLDEFKIRKSKLYYIRDKVGKDAKLKSIVTRERRDSVVFEKTA